VTAPAIPARPTTYRGIKMRSRLEGYFAAMLDGWPGVTWHYEPTCFAGPDGQWLADFRIIDHHFTDYAEVKPWPLIRDLAGVDAILTRMETAWLSDPYAGLVLFFAEAAGGHVSRYVALAADRQGEPWRFGFHDHRGGLAWPPPGDPMRAHVSDALTMTEPTERGNQ
jgi:hypothetical protein